MSDQPFESKSIRWNFLDKSAQHDRGVHFVMDAGIYLQHRKHGSRLHEQMVTHTLVSILTEPDAKKRPNKSFVARP